MGRWKPEESSVIDGVEHKRCTRCMEMKPLNDYYLVQSHGKPWRQARCKSCVKAGVRRWTKANVERHNANAMASYRRHRAKKNLRRKFYMYGLTKIQLRRLYRKYGHRCWICKEKHIKLHIDHCHMTGQVCGLLCRSCNHGLGNFRDSKPLLYRAIAYLEASCAT